MLAHELAHVYRKDAPWRLAATVCRVVHFYNPLMHSLVARLILAQELAADQLAVSNVGGPENYLRSISRLALQQDARAHRASPTLIMPVFSGHWIRRIEMLRATDCRHNRTGINWLLSSAVVVLMVILGIATTVSRGLAEGNEDAKETSAGTSLNSYSGVDTEERRGTISDIFQGETISASHYGFDEHGAVFVNFGRLREKFGTQILETMLSDYRSALGTIGEGFDVSTLDAVMTSARISTSAAGSTNPGEKGRLWFGIADAFLLRTNRDMNWESMIHRSLPNSVDGVLEGTVYTDIPTGVSGAFVSEEAAKSGLAVRTLSVTPRELAILLNLDPDGENGIKLVRRFASKGRNAAAPTWSDEWQAVSGGVAAISLIVTAPSSESIFQGFEGAADANLLIQSIDMISCGIDIRKESQIAEAIVRLRGRNPVDPEQLLIATQKLIELQNRAPESTPGGDVDPVIIARKQLLKYTTVRLIRGKVPVIECRIEYPLPPFLFTPPAAAGTQASPATKRTADSTGEGKTTR